MSRRDDRRRLERLAALQRLARDQSRHALEMNCETTDVRLAAEARSLAGQKTAALELDATFHAPRLCVDRLDRAVRQFHFAEAALADARHSTGQAHAAEDAARAELSHAERRLELAGSIARTLRRKDAEKRENEAILQTLAVSLSRVERP